MPSEIGFWLAVMLVSVAGVALFKIVAAKANVPALTELAAFI